MSASLLDPQLFPTSVVGVEVYPLAAANQLLTEWGHYLGPVNRPFRSEAYALEVAGRPVAVAVSCSIVNGPVGGFQRSEVVELARLCWSRKRYAGDAARRSGCGATQPITPGPKPAWRVPPNFQVPRIPTATRAMKPPITPTDKRGTR